MTVYVDIVFLLNLFYDFLLLLTVNITLKRYKKILSIFLASLLGAFSIFILFLKINNYILFLLKILISILMCIIAFGYKNIKYTFSNILYLYMCSIILGGFMYLLDIELNYKHNNIVYYLSGININYIVLLILSPLILFLYYYQNKKLKIKTNLSYLVKIVLKNNKEYKLNGYIDTGNRIRDPITKKYIIILNKKIYHNKNPIYVSIKTINKTSLIECFPIKYLEINNHIFNNYLIGYMDNKIFMEGADCILNFKLMEDLNV